jgi:hypothetical protein
MNCPQDITIMFLKRERQHKIVGFYHKICDDVFPMTSMFVSDEPSKNYHC